MKYYSTQRPVAPGTFPKPKGNRVMEIVNFDERQYCREAGRDCWGYVEYEYSLTEKQAVDHELVREQLLDFTQRYMVGAGTSVLRTFATAAELNAWFDAQVVEDRHFCRLYDRVRSHILYVAQAGGTVDRRSAERFPQSILAFQRRTLELNRGINMNAYRMPLPDGLYVDGSVAVDSEILAVDQDTRDSTLTKQELRPSVCFSTATGSIRPLQWTS